MSTNLQNKRKTKQVRISTKNHKRIKFEAINKGLTMSKLTDFIIRRYFDNEKNYE